MYAGKKIQKMTKKKCGNYEKSGNFRSVEESHAWESDIDIKS